ncbi:MAG: SDR family NAD(P)-dependent oxidoreductase [Promethearchaeota archaeon]
MKEFKNKTAVITGAASGIGYGIAKKCVQEGMKVVLADIEVKALKKVERELNREGASVLSVLTDVSKVSEVEMLAKKTIDFFGAVHLLFNNAGVGFAKYAWNYTIKDWKWQIGVNLFGVINGIRIFVPIMLEQDSEGLIVNSASIEGLISGINIGGAAYGVSKHAIISLSEILRAELELKKTKLKVFVLCPGPVESKLFLSVRNRQEEFQNDPINIIQDSRFEDSIKVLGDKMKKVSSISPEVAGNLIFQAIRDNKFYILTHTQQVFKDMVKERMREILESFD